MTKKLYSNFKDFDINNWHWPNFTPAELSCKCGKYCNGEYFHDEKFLDGLQKIRHYIGPIVINSARRCLKHNAEVGGASRSMHMREIAVDIKIAPHNRIELYNAAKNAGFTGMGFGVNFMHLDMGQRRRWTYPGGLSIWSRALGFNPLQK